jgi:hypothetical protein
MTNTLNVVRKRFTGNAGRLAILSLTAAITVFARSAGAPAGMTGAPPGTNCTSCHGGSPNTGGGNVRVEFPSGTTYTPGATYKLHIVLTDANAQRWGFEVTARRGTDRLTLAGMLAVDNPATTQSAPGGNAGEYITHTAQGTAQGTTGSNSWDVNWTAPAAGSGPVTIFVAGNAANGNGNNQGDLIYTSSLVLQEAGPDVSGTVFALPQLAFGGGWYTAMYFTNTTDAPANMGVKFNKPDGAALSVPLVGAGPVSSQVITLAPKATAVLEAPNTGDLQQGWAEATLPTGVTGYGVFRQTVAGRPDQEAVVPLSNTSKTVANLVWDDMGPTTAVALVNPSDAAVTATITVYGPDGATLGTATVNLAPNNRTAFNLREQPGLSAMVGKRGSARIAVPSGNVSALGLRFGDSAFTSIPVDYP